MYLLLNEEKKSGTHLKANGFAWFFSETEHRYEVEAFPWVPDDDFLLFLYFSNLICGLLLVRLRFLFISVIFNLCFCFLFFWLLFRFVIVLFQI